MNPITGMMKQYIKMPLKYALPLLFIGVLVCATAGCIDNLNPTATPTAQQATVAPTATKAPAAPTEAPAAPTEAPAAPTEAPSKPSATGFVVFEVNSMTTSSQVGSYPLQSTASPGRTFAVFDVTLTNVNKNNLYLGNPLYFKLTTSDGTVHQYSPKSALLDNYLTGVLNTNPGDKVTGKIAFEIPQSAKATKFSYGDLINGVVTTNL